MVSVKTLETDTLPGGLLEDVRLESTSGLSAHCQVRSPSTTTAGAGAPRAQSRRPKPRPPAAGGRGAPPLPGYLITAGVETGRHAVTFPDVGDAVLMACDYPLHLPESLEPSIFWRGLPELRRALVDSPATLLLAVDYLAHRPDVDPEAIALVGASFGVPSATVAAALDLRVRAVALLYGGGDLPLLFAHNVDLRSAAANRLARALVWILTRPVEPTRYAGAISPRPTLAVSSPSDPFIPRESAVALHAALRAPKEIRSIQLDHFAAFHERDLLAELTRLTADWFRAQGIG